MKQQVSALLSGNSLCYKIWKNEVHASPGQIIEKGEQNLSILKEQLESKDIDIDECELKLGIAHSEFILKSIDVTDKELVEAYKRKNVMWKDKKLLINELQGLRLKCAFSLDKSVLQHVNDIFPISSIVHHIPTLMYGISLVKNEGNTLYCTVSDSWTAFIYLIDNKIKYVNSYENRFPEDILYFMRLVVVEVGSTISETQVQLIGRVQRDSKLHNLIKTYFPHIQFMGEGEEEYIFKDLIWIKECA